MPLALTVIVPGNVGSCPVQLTETVRGSYPANPTIDTQVTRVTRCELLDGHAGDHMRSLQTGVVIAWTR